MNILSNTILIDRCEIKINSLFPDDPCLLKETFIAYGYICEIIRPDILSILNNNLGWGNGYVAIPKDHPAANDNLSYLANRLNIRVHGSITYANFTENDFIIGFDTAHYWPREKVKQETIELARQLRAIQDET